MIRRCIFQAMTQAAKDQVETKYCPRAYESKKVSIVSSPDAIVDPGAVVVLSLNAVVTDSAVMAPRRPPDVARFAIFGRVLERYVLPTSFDVDPFG